MPDTHFSADLLWEVVKPFNAYQVKRRSGGGALFSRDPLNLTNKQTRKHTGFVNDKAVGLKAGKNGGIEISRKKAASSSGSHRPGSHLHSSTISKGGPRESYRIVAGTTSKGGESGYRADLRRDAVARASAIHKSYGTKKDAPAAKPRGSKARKAAA